MNGEILLREHIDIQGAEDYKECELFLQNQRIIWGEGNVYAPIAIILDNPGARENKQGEPFVCGTRCTLQKAISSAKINLEDIYITYLLKCRPLRQYDKAKAKAFSLPFLAHQIKQIQPKILVALGDVVVQALWGSDAVSVKSLREEWHSVWNIPTLVSYHPLAVRRRHNLTQIFQQDWDSVSARLYQA